MFGISELLSSSSTDPAICSFRYFNCNCQIFYNSLEGILPSYVMYPLPPPLSAMVGQWFVIQIVAPDPYNQNLTRHIHVGVIGQCLGGDYLQSKIILEPINCVNINQSNLHMLSNFSLHTFFNELNNQYGIFCLNLLQNTRVSKPFDTYRLTHSAWPNNASL